MTGFRRGPLTALSALILAMGTAAWSEAPTTAPTPRPLALAAAGTDATTAPGPGPRRHPGHARRPWPRPRPAAPTRAGPPQLPRVGPVTGFGPARYVSIRASEGQTPAVAPRAATGSTGCSNAATCPVYGRGRAWSLAPRHRPSTGPGGWVHHKPPVRGARTAIVEAERLPLHARPDRNAMVPRRGRTRRDRRIARMSPATGAR